jgi:hypothetical protein
VPILPPSSNDDAQRIKGVAVDDTAKSDGKYLSYVAASQKLEYVTPPGATGGEANTGSNVGTGGVGVYKTKAGTTLQFKKLNAGSNKVAITDDTANDEVDIDVNPANIAHSGLSGVGTNTHAQIDTHIADATKHRQINDAGTGTTDLWSANKINTELAGKSATGHVHSPAEVTGFEEAVDDRIDALVQDSTSLTTTYNDAGGTMYLDVVANTTTQKVNVSKGGTSVGTRKQINLIEGSNVQITAADNSGSDRVDVTIAATGGGGGGASAINDLSDVTISSPSNGQVLKYNSTTSQWENGTDATGGGGGGASQLDDLSDVAITSAASGDFLRHNGTAFVDSPIQAGDIPTGVDAAKLADGSVSNAELQRLNGVTSDIQTQLDGKVDENSAITGATKTKITYDAKGLVTAGADATQDDIGDGTTYKQYSQTEKSKLAGIATGATANDTDANLKNRANHTGTQTAATISDFTEAAQDVIGALLADSSTIDFTYNDAGNAETVAVIDNSSTQKVVVSKGGTTTGTRKQINFVEGSNVTITTSDNSGSDRVDVTIAASGGGGMSNPMTTAGDIIYGGASGAPTRLGVGTDGHVLTLASGVPTWAAGGGGGSVTPKYRIQAIFSTTSGSTLDDRFTKTVGTGASITGGTTGLNISTGTNSSTGYGKVDLRTFVGSFDGNLEYFAGFSSWVGTADSHRFYHGIGSLTTSGGSITMTGKHIGWFGQRESATTTHRYTCADGTTQNSGTFTGTGGSDFAYIQKNSTTNIKYYYNGTLVGTLTANLPTGATQYPISASATNVFTSANNTFQMYFAEYTKDVY